MKEFIDSRTVCCTTNLCYVLVFRQLRFLAKVHELMCYVILKFLPCWVSIDICWLTAGSNCSWTDLQLFLIGTGNITCSKCDCAVLCLFHFVDVDVRCGGRVLSVSVSGSVGYRFKSQWCHFSTLTQMPTLPYFPESFRYYDEIPSFRTELDLFRFSKYLAFHNTNTFAQPATEYALSVEPRH